jgi:hypothetical protein
MGQQDDGDKEGKAGRAGTPNPNDLIPDPLVTPGFLNIRLKPPLHSRGIR